MSANQLDEAFPAGEIVEGWAGDCYWRGRAGRNGSTHALAAFRRDDFCDDVAPVWVVALDRCPDYPTEEERAELDAWGDEWGGCCGGECEGGPVWRVVKERVPGARRAWRSA